MENLFNPPKYLSLKLVGFGLVSNTYYLINAFKKQAQEEGLTQQDIDLVITEAKSKKLYPLTPTTSCTYISRRLLQ